MAKASEGWKWAFCKRHGIRKLRVKSSLLKIAVDQFVPRFNTLLEKSLSHNQVFNCDETSLYYRLLLQVSKSMLTEAKDRVMLNVCSNISGSVKLSTKAFH